MELLEIDRVELRVKEGASHCGLFVKLFVDFKSDGVEYFATHVI
jgi:hypothetical protein